VSTGVSCSYGNSNRVIRPDNNKIINYSAKFHPCLRPATVLQKAAGINAPDNSRKRPVSKGLSTTIRADGISLAGLAGKAPWLVSFTKSNSGPTTPPFQPFGAFQYPPVIHGPGQPQHGLQGFIGVAPGPASPPNWLSSGHPKACFHLPGFSMEISDEISARTKPGDGSSRNFPVANIPRQMLLGKMKNGFKTLVERYAISYCLSKTVTKTSQQTFSCCNTTIAITL